MSDIKDLSAKLLKFTDERDWDQFHTPKDLAISLVLEASEVLEQFQWKKKKEIQDHIKTNKEELGEELADVAIYLFLLADKLDIDLGEAIEDKRKKNAKKYPINKSRGSAKKYNKL